MPQAVKNLPAMPKTGVRSLGREDSLEKGMATPPVFLLAGQRSLVGYNPWVAKSQTRLSDQHQQAHRGRESAKSLQK